MYGKMTVAQLRETAAERGIDVPGGARKADLVALLESHGGPVEVEAEIVDERLAVTGASLEIDSGVLVSKVREITEALDGLAKVRDEMGATDEEIASMPMDSVAICRKALSSAIKEADGKRLEFGRILRKPVELVNAKCRELTADARALEERYRDRERQAEDDRRLAREAELSEHYVAYAGLLADVVPYAKLHEDAWLNKTVKLQDAQVALESKVDRVAVDWDALKAMGLELHDEAEARFFETLDLGGSVAWANRLAEDRRRIEAMKAELEAREPEPEPGPAPVPAHAEMDAPPWREAEPVVQPVPMPAVPTQAQPVPMPAVPVPVQPVPMPSGPVPMEPQDGRQAVVASIAARLMGYDEGKLRNLDAALANVGAGGPATQRVMVIDAATHAQLDVVGKLCGLVGITGSFRTGTLAEVVQRECDRAAREGTWWVAKHGA